MAYRVREDLKRSCRKNGLSLAALARKADLAYSVVSAAVNGRSNPNAITAQRIAVALGAEPHKLFPDSFDRVEAAR